MDNTRLATGPAKIQLQGLRIIGLAKIQALGIIGPAKIQGLGIIGAD